MFIIELRQVFRPAEPDGLTDVEVEIVRYLEPKWKQFLGTFLLKVKNFTHA